jgi:hypothetical protein
MTTPPDRYIEIEQRLGEPFADFVRTRRDRGVSWRRIANEILLTTGDDISYESLRMWFQGRQPVDTGSAA